MVAVAALNGLAEWPVDNVSAVVVDPSGVVARHGDPDRVYELASVTKLLAAHAFLVAIEEGALELDEPVGPPGATVAHLLSHASGLPFDGRTPEAGVAEQRIYSSAGFEVLAEHLAQVSGIGLAEYLDEGVCRPLGMSDTALTGPAGHGAQASVSDLAAFAAELLQPRLISAETLATATRVWFPGLDGFVPGYGKHRPNDWGLGFEIRSEKTPHWTGSTNSPDTFGHFGQAGTFCWVDPALQAACVVLTDRPFGPWAKPLWSEFNDGVVASLR